MLPRAFTATQNIVAKATQVYRVLDEQRDIFESHRHHVFSVAYYMTGDEREAETVLQSTFMQAFEEDPRPSADHLDQKLMGELRSRMSFEPVAPVVVAHEGSQGLGGKNVRRTDMEEALWQLPEQERLCFLLRDVEGYKPERIAEVLAISESDVQRTVLSARLRIRGLLMEQRSAALSS